MKKRFCDFFNWCLELGYPVHSVQAYNIYNEGCAIPKPLSEPEREYLERLTELELLQFSMSGKLNSQIVKLILNSKYNYVERSKQELVVSDNVTIDMSGLGKDAKY